MQQFIGTKIVNAKPMNRSDYNVLRGWKLPDDEDGTDEGYLVEYLDGGKSNVEGFSGYVSWSPKEVFINAYSTSGSLTFGDALIVLKAGGKVARAGWNGKGMWLVLVPGTPNIVPRKGSPYSDAGVTEEVEILSHIDMYTVNSTGRRAMLPGWLASQTDMLSSDWCIVD